MTKYYPLRSDIMAVIRAADTFTGELRASGSEEVMRVLRDLGLAGDAALTELGMAVRSWLFKGTDHAPDEVGKLLGLAVA